MAIKEFKYKVSSIENAEIIVEYAKKDRFGNQIDTTYAKIGDIPDGAVTTSSTLTADTIVVGNGDKTVKNTSHKVGTFSTPWDISSDVYVPTMKSISNKFVTLNTVQKLTATKWFEGEANIYFNHRGSDAPEFTLNSVNNLMTVRYFRGDGTAEGTVTIPNKTGTVAMISDIPDVSGKIDTAGTGLSKSGTTLNHSNSVTAVTSNSFLKVKYDAQGHITGSTSVTANDIPALEISKITNLQTTLENIREIAEGKSAAYVIDSKSKITGTETDTGFNTVTAITASSGTDAVVIANLRIGDVINNKTVTEPDYWVSGLNKNTSGTVTSVTLNFMETAKQKVTDIQINGSSILSNTVANFNVDGTQSSTNKILTKSAANGYYVDFSSQQNITGVKSFTMGAVFGGPTSFLSSSITINTASSAGSKKTILSSKNISGSDINVSLPGASGTLALTSDIPTVPTNYVTTDTEQTISGSKTFSSAPTVTATAEMGQTVKSTLYGDGIKVFNSSGTPFDLVFPSKSGTFALTNDIVDTKNTAGTTNKTATKMYLVGATSQGANPQTYSNSSVYIGTDNCLYSNGAKVLTSYTNTTYTFAEGSTDGAFSVTPSGGSAQSVAVHGVVKTSGAQTISGSKTFNDVIYADDIRSKTNTSAALIQYKSYSDRTKTIIVGYEMDDTCDLILKGGDYRPKYVDYHTLTSHELALFEDITAANCGFVITDYTIPTA